MLAAVRGEASADVVGFLEPPLRIAPDEALVGTGVDELARHKCLFRHKNRRGRWAVPNVTGLSSSSVNRLFMAALASSAATGMAAWRVRREQEHFEGP